MRIFHTIITNSTSSVLLNHCHTVHMWSAWGSSSFAFHKQPWYWVFLTINFLLFKFFVCLLLFLTFCQRLLLAIVVWQLWTEACPEPGLLAPFIAQPQFTGEASMGNFMEASNLLKIWLILAKVLGQVLCACLCYHTRNLRSLFNVNS